MADRNVTPPKVPQIKPKLVIIVLAVVVLLILLFSSFYVVDQTEQAVVLRFGQFSRITGPGLNFKIPFGIEKNYNVPTQTVHHMQFGFRTQEAGVTTTYTGRDYPEESIMLTGDLNIADVEWVIQYRINDPYNWLFKVEYQEETLRDISQSVINRLVGDRAILDVISSERANIEVQGRQHMNDIFNAYNLGVNITTVKLRNIVPPKGSVQDAFEDVNKAIQDMNRLINEGKEQYNSQIPKARGEASQLIQQAQGYAAERVNEARGNVARFNAVLEEYTQSPQVTRRRLYIEMIEDIFDTEEGSDLIDKSLDNFLPLKSLQEGGTQ